MSMFLQNALRPIVRILVPLRWQHEFSGWVYSKAVGPASWVDLEKHTTINKILHRIYWITNPRGER